MSEKLAEVILASFEALFACFKSKNVVDTDQVQCYRTVRARIVGLEISKVAEDIQRFVECGITLASIVDIEDVASLW